LRFELVFAALRASLIEFATSISHSAKQPGNFQILRYRFRSVIVIIELGARVWFFANLNWEVFIDFPLARIDPRGAPS